MKKSYVLRIPKRALIEGFLTVFILTAGLLSGWGLYKASQIPAQVVASLESPRWHALNVRLYPFHSRKEFDLAEHRLTSLIQQPADQNDPIPSFLRGELYQTLGDFRKAQKDYGRALQISQNNWFSKIKYSNLRKETLSQLAICYYKSNDYKKLGASLSLKLSSSQDETLLKALSDAIEDPERADFHFILAKALLQDLEIEKARQELLTAKRLAQSPQLLMEIENYKQTQMPYQTGKLSPMLRYYAEAAAYYQHDRNDAAQAIGFLQKAVQMAPTFEWLHNELALAYRKNQQYEAAKRYAKVAVAINPNLYQAYLTLGDLAIDQSQYKLAIQNFQKAHSIISNLPNGQNQQLQANVYNQLGYAFECLREWQAAQDNYRLAMTDADSRDDVDAETEYQYAQEALERISTNRALILSQGNGKSNF